MRAVRHAVKKTLLAMGREDFVQRYQRANRPPMEVRDERDMHQLAVLMRFGLSPNANCIDVGANRGDVLRQIVDLFPNGTHQAFEPLPELAAQLRQEFPNVTVHESALSSTASIASFTQVTTPGLSGYSGFRKQWYPADFSTEVIKVRTSMLDDVLPRRQRVDFIKIDVEGAELEVLHGARLTLAQHRPLIVFEHFQGGAEAYGYGPSQIHQLLSDLGYSIFDIDGAGPYSVSSMEHVFKGRSLWTWVARPDHQG